ncbi:SOK1 protein [Sodiomyces alkalinus F11]|uniref:SOK1 protein n=1 Tax=Sodiomyces alkalinus (strain CBS 110278 / VKM F-3762 / F11) TaxID=1314773 RepID=A0A3N2Q6V5_SODAK|nr:SOK1 protein [Sodiomyces alkalinus F11]ROT42480.1 SOK1 protein [Sodiomyces alkalinus F11]
MTSKQGAGGGIESNRRQLSTSARASNENEPTQETEDQPTTIKPAQSQKEETQFVQAPQGLPRNINPSSNAATPPTPSLPMSRAASTSSSVGGPTASTDGYFSHHTYATKPKPSLPLDPPVTKATMGELDISKINSNLKLRHDINFDAELHFRPNVEGDKGKRKGARTERFWNTLHEQLNMFVLDRQGFYETYGYRDDWCLPRLLKTVKDIIQTLVPGRDRVHLNEGLNVELLMQQFNKGTADLEKLAYWLAGVLKSHCAPMRDEWVDRMYQKLSKGNRNNDMGEIVRGLRGLLEVLEAMKLDVANHQIRSLRPILIEDTVLFEQRFFFRQMQEGHFDITPAGLWYRDSGRRYRGTVSPAAAQSFGEMAIFFEGLARLMRPSVDEKEIPTTFVFDEERLLRLRSNMLDAINLEICMRHYDDLERVSRSVSSLLSGFLARPDEDHAASRSRSFFGANASSYSGSSRPSSLAFSCAGSDTSSPRSSFVHQTQASAGPDAAEAKAKSRNLYNSLIALLETSPVESGHKSRWAALAPSLALQIFRYTNAPSDMLPAFEAKLQSHVTDVQSSLFREVEDQFNARLLAKLQRRVREFKGLPGFTLFSITTASRSNATGRVWDGDRDQQQLRISSLHSSLHPGSLLDGSGREARGDGAVEDMATRLAHLGVLHWRVWAQLAYAGDVDGDLGSDVQPGTNQI